MTGPQPSDVEETRTPEIILSSEELVIDTQLVESGRARLVKRVQVETVTWRSSRSIGTGPPGRTPRSPMTRRL
jgi:hypothetical protein